LILLPLLCWNESKMSLIKIYLQTFDFAHFFRVLYASEPERILSVSTYKVFDQYAQEEVILCPADESITIIRFVVGEVVEDVTIYSQMVLLTPYADELTQKVFVECSLDKLELYKNVCREISFYRGKANAENNEILFQEIFKDNLSVARAQKIPVIPLEKLATPSDVSTNCIKYIDAFGANKVEKCNILLYGEMGTGKMSLVKALALHYKKALTVISSPCENSLKLIRDNVLNNSIICFRSAETMGPMMLELLDSYFHFHQKKFIVFMIANDPKAIPVIFFSPARIGHIAKLEPLKKQEIKQYVKKMILNISEDTLKTCISTLEKLGAYGVTIAALSNYIQRFGNEDGSSLLLPENLKEINEQLQLRKEILQMNSEKMYS